MSIADLRITEVHYNPAEDTPPFLEITNTGSDIVASGDFIVGNSDFGPEYYQVIGPNAILAPRIEPGQVLILVPSVPDTSGEVFVPPVPVSQAEFEAIYGPLPENAVYYNYPAFFVSSDGPNPYNGSATYTISGLDIFGDSVFIPGGALAGQSVSVSLEDGTTSFGPPSPGVAGSVAPPPPPPTGVEIEGTAANEELNGTGGDDSINGGAGDDLINGRNGDDFIEGGDNLDTINGGNGDDEIYGGRAVDNIRGGNGEDLIYGGGGSDTIHGGADDDLIFGDHGWDVINAGSGNDEVYGGRSNDNINGGIGNDLLFGDSGNDTLRGGDGDDDLYGGSQADHLFGGAGEDRLEGGRSNDRLAGGEGADTFVFAGVVNNDIITDFELGVDQIDVTAYGPMSASDVLDMISGTGNAVVDFGSVGEVRLNGVAAEDLTLDNFIYLPDDIFVVG